MNDGPFARMLAELDAELPQKQNASIEAACEMVDDLGRAMGFAVVRSPEKAARMADLLRRMEAFEPGTLDRLGAHDVRTAGAAASTVTAH